MHPSPGFLMLARRVEAVRPALRSLHDTNTCCNIVISACSAVSTGITVSAVRTCLLHAGTGRDASPVSPLCCFSPPTAHSTSSSPLYLSPPQFGMGVRSSALVAGYSHSHRELEQGLATLKGTEECLLFPTGEAPPPVVQRPALALGPQSRSCCYVLPPKGDCTTCPASIRPSAKLHGAYTLGSQLQTSYIARFDDNSPIP
jgi:hypothetical protein